jgi:uncharacterized protein (TIGR03067 family)
MRRLLSIVIGVVLLGIAEARPTTDLDRLQGTWMPKDGTFDGAPAPLEVLRDRQWVIRGDQLEEIVKGRRESRATIKVDAAQKPAAIDLAYTEGQGKGLTGSGIYQMDSDTLVVCIIVPGARPTDFAAPRGSGRALLVFKRAK